MIQNIAIGSGNSLLTLKPPLSVSAIQDLKRADRLSQYFTLLAPLRLKFCVMA